MWWEYPQKIQIWEPGVDYVMFVDENGSSQRISDIFKRLTNNEEIDENNKYFTITGCIFKKYDYYLAQNEIKQLKRKFWEDGFYFDTKHKDKRKVCFHSREIRRHDGAFNDKLINHNTFIDELSIVLKNIECKIISVSINLEEYLRQGYLNNVYETAFDFLLERYIYSTSNNKKGIIMLEARGKQEDKQLLKHIYDVIHNRGRKNITTQELESKIVGVYFNPKWSENYDATYTGIEIVDLFSYPIHQYIKFKERNLSFETIENKIVGYPNYINKGIKIFPKEKDD